MCVWGGAQAALLAVLRVGCVFIPNDPNDPSALRAVILKAAGVSHVLTRDAALLPDVPEGLSVIDAAAALASEPDSAPAATFRAADLAAIFFSSGSTGTPKGVQHSALIWYEYFGCHQGVADLCHDPAALSPVSWCDGTWHGSITWYSSWTCFSDIVNGKKVVIVSHSTLLDSVELQALRVKHGIKQMYFPPAHLRTILDTESGSGLPAGEGLLADLELIYVWGEKLDSTLVDMVGARYPDVEMLDWFGTSETFLGIQRRFRPATRLPPLPRACCPCRAPRFKTAGIAPHCRVHRARTPRGWR